MALAFDHFAKIERDILDRCMSEIPLETNPLGVELLNTYSSQNAVAAIRRERASNRVWQRYEFMTDYFTRLGCDETMGAIVKRPTGLRVFTFSKERSDGRFGARSARMLQLLVNEISAIPPHRLALAG